MTWSPVWTSQAAAPSVARYRDTLDMSLPSITSHQHQSVSLF